MIIFYETHFNGVRKCHRIVEKNVKYAEHLRKAIIHLGFKIVKTIPQKRVK